MASSSFISFSPEFGAPSVKARFEVLMLVASCLRSHLVKLAGAIQNDESPTEWNEVVGILAERLGNQFPKIKNVAEVVSIWEQFRNDASVLRLPGSAKNVLDSVALEIEEKLKAGEVSATYLARANGIASGWITDLISRQNLGAVGKVSKARIYVQFDEKSEQFCASTTRLSGMIHWEFQPMDYSLYGALVAELILEHEYFSHLLPLNEHFSNGVCETWLLVALRDEHRDTDTDREQHLIDQFLWEKFRFDLSRHFDKRDIELYGPLGLEGLASRMRFHAPVLFWEFTLEILRTKNHLAFAHKVDELFEQLLRMPGSVLKRFLEHPWKGLSAASSLASKILP